MQEEQNKILYSNSAQISTSIYDFIMKLNFNTMDEKGAINSKELVQIAMSPQHFKVFLEISNSHLQAYEQKFGIIQTPEKVKEDNA